MFIFIVMEKTDNIIVSSVKKLTNIFLTLKNDKGIVFYSLVKLFIHNLNFYMFFIKKKKQKLDHSNLP